MPWRALFVFLSLSLLNVPLQLLLPDIAAAITADEALHQLKEGNERFANDLQNRPNQDQARRHATAVEGQEPFATILACSDSRVVPEILFDSGIGDIFVVRVAGNVAGIFEAGSIEYAVQKLGTPLLVVLGHTRCGAVSAVCKNEEVHGNLLPLVENIRVAVIRTRTAHPELSGDTLVEEAIKENVRQGIEDLLAISEPVRAMVKAGTLKIVGAVYDTRSGRVQWLEPVSGRGL